MTNVSDHLVPLPGTTWNVWRHTLVRSAGFPADGVAAFCAPELARTVDRYLEDADEAARVDTAFADAMTRLGRAVHDVCADPLFRQAVTWQNPGALSSVAGVLRDGPAARRNERRRRREEIVAKYWQRYCTKNDTIGFFGPMCWSTVDNGGPRLEVRHGPALVRDTAVHFEWWALDALAAHLATDERLRPWLPVARQPQLRLDGRRLVWPNRPPQDLPAGAAELVARCDGRRRAGELAAGLTAAGTFRRPADVYAQLDELAAAGILRLGFDLPMDLGAERLLREQLDGIGDAEARERALATMDRLCDARDAVAAADGPDELANSMAVLEDTFTRITGQDARRRPGETYAGRTLCHLDSVRDLDVTVGGDVLARLAGLAPLLQSARWLSAGIAAAYTAALTELYRELAADAGGAEVPLRELWFMAQALVFGDERPADPVVADFLRRWTAVLGLEDVGPGTAELRFTAEELGARAAEAFPADRPGWSEARVHSPDVHLCATDAEALARGDYTLVLGELHIASAAFDTQFFALGHPAPQVLREALAADLPDSRVRLLLPHDWPRHCSRNAYWMNGPHDVELGFVPAPGADPDRLVPVTALTVTDTPDGLVARAEDGRQWPILEVFANMLGLQAFDTWKLAGADGHTPRITVDDLVLVRRTWRSTIGAGGLADVTGEQQRFVAARRWRRAEDMPEQVYVRVATDIKPQFVDFTSPVYVRLLCTMLRGARAKGGDDVEVIVTEALPTAEHAWLADGQGRRYSSELRLQIIDPEPPGRP
ncbi:lantibiotic dehydratase [Streptomyces cadmiisoli]|uniref:lantibiotic dehydratase n=1 Tax=Streptomyces cadmiisoli TaxID=2184053 RepID=UPI0018EFD505|nr:lantibiotic dehydratase [Streptomyces cadmiisoli]